MLIPMIAFNYSLWYVSGVHSKRVYLRSISLYRKLIATQWLICLFLILPLILNEQIVNQRGIFLCQISLTSILTFILGFNRNVHKSVQLTYQLKKT